MTDRPILFSAPMVRALMSGTKTQTRRVVKFLGADVIDERDGRAWPWSPQHDEWVTCPYGSSGDRLWVRETWAAHWMYDDVPPTLARSTHPDDNQWFAADVEGTPGTHGCPAEGRRGKWRPSIHMPRWASRITLDVTGVRVERLNDISAADAMAEGIRRWTKDGTLSKFGTAEPGDDGAPPWVDMPRSAVDGYRTLWESINGAGSWTANPWVWVVSFRRATT